MGHQLVSFDKMKPLELCVVRFFHITQNPTNLGSERGKFSKENLSISAGARGLCGVVKLVLRPRAVARGRETFRSELEVIKLDHFCLCCLCCLC